MAGSIIEENSKRSINDFKIAICSIVRDCSKQLERNIPVIEKLRSFFKDSVVIINENDSKDKTKLILKNWEKNSTNVLIESENFGNKTIPDQPVRGVNKYYSDERITKMADYRNKYLDKLEKINFDPDFVLIVDLDVSIIYLEGISNY